MIVGELVLDTILVDVAVCIKALFCVDASAEIPQAEMMSMQTRIVSNCFINRDLLKVFYLPNELRIDAAAREKDRVKGHYVVASVQLLVIDIIRPKQSLTQFAYGIRNRLVDLEMPLQKRQNRQRGLAVPFVALRP